MLQRQHPRLAEPKPKSNPVNHCDKLFHGNITIMLLRPAFFTFSSFFFSLYRIRKSVARRCTAAAVNILIIQTGTKRFQNVFRVGSSVLSPVNS